MRRVPPGVTGPFTTWWNDDQVREVGSYLEGRRHGDVRGYHPDGTLSFAGSFKDGAPDGLQQAWHPGGERALEAEFVEGIAHGERREYDEQGVLRRRVEFVQGRTDGKEVHYSAEGRVVRRGQSVAGLPVGPWREFDAQGRLVAETIHLRSGDGAGGRLETSFDPDGPPRVQMLHVLQSGIWTGRITTWHADGSLASVAGLREGQPHGLERSFDALGRLRSEGRRVQGLRTGVWTWWDEHGRVERSVSYEAGRAVPGEAAQRDAG
jgi:antitoxin component YwqK of YwqJK toxin-antitoxin module